MENLRWYLFSLAINCSAFKARAHKFCFSLEIEWYLGNFVDLLITYLDSFLGPCFDLSILQIALRRTFPGFFLKLVTGAHLRSKVCMVRWSSQFTSKAIFRKYYILSCCDKRMSAVILKTLGTCYNFEVEHQGCSPGTLPS